MNPLVNVLMVIVPILLVTNLGIHNIEEGYVGVYYRVFYFLQSLVVYRCCIRILHEYSLFLQGGALLSEISLPGFHMLIPFITTYKAVQVCFIFIGSVDRIRIVVYVLS